LNTYYKKYYKKSRKHAILKTHLKNREQIHPLKTIRIEHTIWENRRLTAQKYNEQVAINKRILARMVHIVCYLEKQELAFGGHWENKINQSY